MKRMFFGIAALAILLLCFFVTAFAETATVDGVNFTYAKSTSTKEIGATNYLSQKVQSTTNGNASVIWDNSNACFTLSVTNSTYYSEYKWPLTWYYQAQNYIANLTVTNNTDNAIKIQYRVEGTIDSHSAGRYSQTLLAGNSITFELATKESSPEQRTSNTLTGYVYIENLSELENVDVSFASSSRGGYNYQISGGDSVTVEKSAATSASQTVPFGTQVALTHGTVESGYTFYGWMANEKLLGTADGTYTIEDDAVIYPVYISTEEYDKGSVYKVGSNEYWSWNPAVVDALQSGNTIVLNRDYSLPTTIEDAGLCADYSDSAYLTVSGNKVEYIIPYGVMLVIPYDEAGTPSTTAAAAYASTAPKNSVPYAFRKLIIPTNTSVTVNGELSVSGRNSSTQGSNGSPYGPLGYIDMLQGSSITVNNGAKLYVWGYITGVGNVTVERGGIVYESFQITDWRGGTAVITEGLYKNDQGVFVISQYYVQNIEVPLTLKYGAVEKVHTLVAVSGGEAPLSPTFIGEGGLFIMLDETASVTKSYDAENDRLIIDLEGSIKISNMLLAIKALGILDITLDSADFELPLNSNITLNINSESKVTICQDVALLPGAIVNINEGAEVALGSGQNIYVYDADEWEGFVSASDKKYVPLQCVSTGKLSATVIAKREADLETDATVVVNGNMDASAGNIYVTSSGANICSSGGGVIKLSTTTESTTYQYSQISSDNQYGEYSYVPITVRAADLQNDDGTYTAATVANTYTYTDGKWVCAVHNYVYGTPVPATCAAGGYTPGECSVCGATTQKDVTAKLEHVYGDGVVTKPTCTEDGYYTFTCQNGCGDSYTTAGDSALGHTWVNGTEVPPTCTTDGYTPQSCSVCGATNTTNVQTQLGHDYESEVTAPTCTEKGYTTHTCSRCDDSYTDTYTDIISHSYNAGVVTKDPTCTETGVKTYTCGTCGGTKTETVAATGHTEATIEAVAPTCTETGLTAGVKCSVCNAVLTAQQEVPAAEHAWNAGVETTAPTCTTDGEKTYTCDTCGGTKTEAVSSTGHNYTPVVTPPTCEADGYTTYTCQNGECNDTYTADEVDATGHKWNTGVVTTAPTCTEKGVKTFTCENDPSHTRTEEIAATGHSYSSVVTDPTCTAQGYTTHTCSSCGNSKVDTYVDALQHSYTTNVTAPTCTEKGYTTYTCTRGDHTYVADYKDAKGHTYGQPSYDWNGTELTVTLTCSVCDSDTTGHTLSGSADGTEKSHTDGDCQTMSTTTYTATVSLNGTTYTNETTINGVLGDHSWNGGVQTVDPTCKDEGVKTLTCTVDGCGETKTESIPKTNDHTDKNPDDGICDVCKDTVCTHVWDTPSYSWAQEDGVWKCTATRYCSEDNNHVQTVTVSSVSFVKTDATCAEMGVTLYTATFDMNWEGIATQTLEKTDIPKSTEHNWNDGKITTAPGCESTGVKTLTCETCGATKTATVEKTGHSYTTTVTAPTCEEQGYTTHQCSNCESNYKDSYVNALGHNYNGVQTTAPTCTEDGVMTYTCQNDSEHTYTEAIKELGHDYESVVTAPTCTEKGYTTHTCSRCDDSYTDTYTDTVSHSYDDGVVTKDPTCTATGVKTFTCGTCGGTKTETVAATGHTEATIEAVAPTCTETGLTAGVKCSVCNAVLTAQQEVPAAEHAWNAGVETTAPTCTTDGEKTYTCDTCGGTKTEAVSSTGHNYTPVVTPPTCEADGYTTYTCQNGECNDTYTADEVDATGHKWNTGVVTTAPTCTEKGVKTFTCEHDDSHTYSEEIAATGHSYNTVVTDPTCEAAGYTTYTCTNTGCNYSYQSDEIAKLNHTWDEGVVTTESTCTEKGVKTFTCDTCGDTKTTELDYAQHTYDDGVVTPATCESGGYTTYTCTNCTDSYIDNEVSARVHEYNKGVVTPPTCTENGYTTYTCTYVDCGHSYTVDGDAALGHTEVVDAAVAPTCTATGLTEGKHCSVCDMVLTAQEVVDQLGHSYESVVTAPTCTEGGYTTYTCSTPTCGDSYVADPKPATGHVDTNGDNLCDNPFGDGVCNATVCDHTWSNEIVYEWSDDRKSCIAIRTCTKNDQHTEKAKATVTIHPDSFNASCTEDGKTHYIATFVEDWAADDEEIVTVTATGHALTQVEEKNPTCTEIGYSAYEYCSKCTYTTYSEIPSLGHEEVPLPGKDATCIETGLTEGKKCTVCGNITVEQKTLPANGHSNEESTTIEPTCATVGEKTLTCTVCGATSTKEIPATNNHDYSEVKCDKEYQWKKCATCDATNFKAPRTFRIVFQVGERGGDDDIVLPGVYFYGYDETFIVPEFKSNFFAYEYNWAVDGQKLEPGSTMNVSALATLIKTDPTDSEWNTIYVEGGYKVSGLDPNAIMMSMQYENNTGAEGDIFLTLSIFVRVEPGMMHEVVQSGGTDQLTIKKSQVGNLGLYHYQIPLTAEQMNDENLKIKISYTENGNSVWSKEIGVNLTAYSAALNDFLGGDATGDAAQVLVNATMAYGAAIQTMDKKDANGNVIEEGSVATLNAFNEFWRNDAKKVGLSDADIKVPEFSQEATYLTDSEGNLILDAENKPIPIARISAANVAMDKTYALLYRFKLNLPEGAELKNANIILTDVENALNDRTTKWDGTTGTSYTYESSGEDADGTTYYEVWVKNVPASEMTVRYATVYVEYTVNGTEYCAYSQTVKYGVITYLNIQIDKMLNKEGFVISKADDSDLKQLYLWDNLRTVAKYAEKDTKN